MTTPGQNYGVGSGVGGAGGAAGGTVAGSAVALPPRPGADAPAPRRPSARLRSTPPRRLWTLGSVLALLAVLFGALTVTQVVQSSNAASSVVTHSQPLSDDAAQIFHSLADADTTAATGFLQAGNETDAVRKQYNNDIQTASTLLAQAAASTSASDPGQQQIQQLNSQLPVYTGLVDTARADDRQGLPLGGAYLRYASGQLQNVMLPEAQTLYAAETARLHQDYANAEALPWAAIGLGLVTLGALVWAQIRLFRRTNRVFNVGMVVATAATAVAVIWLTAAQSIAASDLNASNTRGAAPLQVLNEARITALQCRGAENLNLVARGSTDTYETAWAKVSAQLAGKNGYLSDANGMTASDPTAQNPIRVAAAAFTTWQQRHDTAKSANDHGDYTTAVNDTIGVAGATSTQTTSAAFTQLDDSLNTAISRERANFHSLADAGRGDTALLAEGAGVLAALAAAGALLGINRRVAEYR
ncbi:hypothetical protein ABIA33_005311 [Streptacidiphilus sp. MAP12-16]|uniref:hypothetical protein n=1 Tax=Streptacidiphilus sp. MAP12-16 TaxID=3156300 RepID=UPI003513C54A